MFAVRAGGCLNRAEQMQIEAIRIIEAHKSRGRLGAGREVSKSDFDLKIGSGINKQS